MFINSERRAESFSYLRESNSDLSLPSYEDLPSDPELIASFLEQLKPKQYAALALSMDEVLKKVTAVPLAAYYAEGSTYCLDDPYWKMRSYSLATFWEAIGDAEGTPEFQQAAEYPRLIGKLDPKRFIDLKMQLYAGADTATSNMLTILRHLPSIIKYHSPDIGLSDTDLSNIARRSIGMPWRMAMMCVNQMIALKSVVSNDRIIDQSWASSEIELDPNYFKLKWSDSEIVAVTFNDVEKFELPEGYTPFRTVPALTAPATLGDIQCSQTSTIGCPITLLPQRLNSLWEWFVDGVDQNKMWEH